MKMPPSAARLWVRPMTWALLWAHFLWVAVAPAGEMPSEAEEEGLLTSVAALFNPQTGSSAAAKNLDAKVAEELRAYSSTTNARLAQIVEPAIATCDSLKARQQCHQEFEERYASAQKQLQGQMLGEFAAGLLGDEPEESAERIGEAMMPHIVGLHEAQLAALEQQTSVEKCRVNLVSALERNVIGSSPVAAGMTNLAVEYRYNPKTDQIALKIRNPSKEKLLNCSVMVWADCECQADPRKQIHNLAGPLLLRAFFNLGNPAELAAIYEKVDRATVALFDADRAAFAYQPALKGKAFLSIEPMMASAIQFTKSLRVKVFYQSVDGNMAPSEPMVETFDLPVESVRKKIIQEATQYYQKQQQLRVKAARAKRRK